MSKEELEFISQIIALITASGGGGAFVIRWLINRKKLNAAKEVLLLPSTPTLLTPQEDILESIKKARKLRVGCIKHPPLCDFTYAGGETVASGLYVEMCKFVCQQNGYSVEFIGVDWSDLEYSFKHLNLHFVLSVFETPERMTYGDFTGVFHTISVGGVARKDNDKVRSLQDLQKGNVKIAVTMGEKGWEYLVKELNIPKRRLIQIVDPDITNMMEMVRSGKADVAIADDVSCFVFCSQYDDVVHLFRDEILFHCKNGIMLPKSQALLASWIYQEFRRAKNTPHIQEIESKILSEYKNLIFTIQ